LSNKELLYFTFILSSSQNSKIDPPCSVVSLR